MKTESSKLYTWKYFHFKKAVLANLCAYFDDVINFEKKSDSETIFTKHI